MAERLLAICSASYESSEQVRNLCRQVWHGAGGRHLVSGNIAIILLLLLPISVDKYCMKRTIKINYSKSMY